MNDLQGFMTQAWADHADDAAGVALRLPKALDAVTSADELMALARLAHHVYGEHLAAWSDGLKFLAALARGPGFEAHGQSGRLLRDFRAGMALAAGASDVRGTLDGSARIAVTARAAMLLALHDAGRSRQLFDEALAAADAAALPAADPAHRALAVAGNNAAGSLKDKTPRSAAETELMILAAQASRRYWALAGTWLETERAECGLAMAWLAAGDAARARAHAQACLAIVDAQAAPAPLERFFGCEALALAERAVGNATAQAQAVAAARAAFEQLSADDQGWCRASLDRIAT